jgi:serine/threonine protein kinase
MDTESIGPYRILEPLGHGGMGVVFRARHVSSERAVALKTVKVTAPRWFDSIRREIQALTRIRHPGIVRILEHGVHQGRPWYAMDLLEGEDLRRFGERIWSPYRRVSNHVASTDGLSLTDAVSSANDEHNAGTARAQSGQSTQSALTRAPAGADQLRAIIQLFRRICSTLAFLHGEGFINCDCKPENVLIVDSYPVLIDFGLTARHPGGSGREALDVPRNRAGTLPYMSPEQIRGEFVDARSDLYAIGCMLYELVCGAPPFAGAPRAIMTQHLEAAPAAPSHLVDNIPEELERILFKLLQKDPADRYGFADEVTAELGQLIGDVQRIPDFPPPRSYLYRPRFVGRDDILRELVALRERAAGGSGGLALIAGESGVGKTRLAMEVTRVGLGSEVRIIISEASALSPDSSGGLGAVPLHAVRPLLQAIADRCHEVGAEMTERLLGDRRDTLALYEPLLAQVPADQEPAPLAPLGVQASRERLFRFLREALSAFAQEQPILWVIDDLGWADELSLAFLQSLDTSYLERTPVFILCTYRSEESHEMVADLTHLPHVVHRAVPRLDRTAVRLITRDMLALREPADSFIDFFAREAEGNPFFLAEYIRAAVMERLLYRDQHDVWQLRERSSGDARAEPLHLPRSLQELIEHRWRRLSQSAQQVGLVAAVLGREVDADLLGAVLGLSDEATALALDELVRRQVLEQSDVGRMRFVHDKLREVAYARAHAEELVELHGKAAAVLEARLVEGEETHAWAALGHHFAVAKRAAPAVRYLKLAAGHARKTHAHGEAARLYREAITLANQSALGLTEDTTNWQQSASDLSEALGDVLALVGEREAARKAFDDAQARVTRADRTTRARLFRKIGKTWETAHNDDEALRYYGIAQEELGQEPLTASPEVREEWIHIALDRLWGLYWLNRVTEMEKLVAELRPLIDDHGSPHQRVRFFQNQMQLNFRRDRYVVSEQTLGYAREALIACGNNPPSAELPLVQFGYGFALLFHNSRQAAEYELGTALQLAERAGDPALQVRSLAYLCLIARMRGDSERVEQLLVRTDELAKTVGTKEYVAMMHGNRAWLAVRGGDTKQALEQAQRALDIWAALTLVFPFQWTALLPLLEAALKINDLSRAVQCVSLLCSSSQQYLPGLATDALNRAKSHWGSGNATEAQQALLSAIELLRATEYH